MSSYRVEVKFAGDKSAFIIWYMDSPSSELLITDVVDKLRAWLGAKGMFLKKMNALEWSMMLVTVHLGTVVISVVESDEVEAIINSMEKYHG